MSCVSGIHSPVYPALCLVSLLRRLLQRNGSVCSVLFLIGFQGLAGQKRGGFRKRLLLYEHFDSLLLGMLHCKGHRVRSSAVNSTSSQKSRHACFEPDLGSLEIFGLQCLTMCYLRCFLFVRQLLLDMIECMDQPSLVCTKTGHYSSLHLDLGGLLFIPNLADGILCCLWQAIPLLFPFLQNGDNGAEGLWKTV